jgi:Tol biopolymer transport system component
MTMRRTIPSLIVAVTSCLLLLLIGDREAPATFPGENGKIAYNSSDGYIHTMNPDGSGTTILPIPAEPYGGAEPAFSPDGTKITFYSSQNSEKYEIYTVNIDGTDVTRLTNNSANDMEPTFSPDGKKIAFTSDRDGNYEIYVMSIDGSGQTNLTRNLADDAQPSFSPDGSKIAFSSWGGRDPYASSAQIYTMNADGTQQSILTTKDLRDTNMEPSFSPDGEQIVFSNEQGNGSNTTDVAVVNSDGSGQINLGPGFSPTFSPDGEKIVFSTELQASIKSSDIYVMNSDGSHRVNITNTEPQDGQERYPDWMAVDTTLPNVSLAGPANGGAFNGIVPLKATASDNVAISEVRFLVDGAQVGVDNTAPYELSWNSGPISPGRKSLTAQAVDTAANQATSALRSIIVDRGAPRNTSFLIKGGATTTKSRTVTLYPRANDPAPASGVAYMRFRNYPSTTWSGWFPYASSKPWILTAGKGNKTVYVQYKDRAGNVSAPAYDSIKYAP